MQRSLFLVVGGVASCNAHLASAATKVADMAVMFPSSSAQAHAAGIQAVIDVAGHMGLQVEIGQATRQLEFDASIPRRLTSMSMVVNEESICSMLAEEIDDQNVVLCSADVEESSSADIEGETVVALSVEIQGSDQAGQTESMDRLHEADGKISDALWNFIDGVNGDESVGDLTQVAGDSVIEVSFLATDSVGTDSFHTLYELGQVDAMFQSAVATALNVEDKGEVLAVVVEAEVEGHDEGSSLVSAEAAPHHPGERQAPASTGRGIQRAAVEKDAPVYRALAGFGHDPYCSDPYADPYNPYCAFCEINELEDSLPDGYVIVSAETTNYHPAGGIIEQDSGALVGCDDGYTATFGDEPAAVNCSLTLESDGDGYEDRSAPFVFDSHPPVGGGLTCFPTDLLPMQYCDTNPVTVEHNLRTSNPGLIDIGDNISVVCRGGYTDPDDDDNSDVLFCNAGPNTSVAASFGEGLSCVDIDSICVVSPGQCTTLADTSISFEQCDNMLDGGNLIDEFNDAFLDFLFGFLGFSVVPPPQLSPTCGSIYLNAYFDDPADAAAFRSALIDAFQNNNITELEFTFNGETVSFSMEDLVRHVVATNCQYREDVLDSCIFMFCLRRLKN